MKKIKAAQTWLAVLALMVLTVPVSVFANAETAGEKIDQTTNDAKNGAKKTAHKAKKGVKKGTHKAADKVEEGAEKVQDKTE